MDDRYKSGRVPVSTGPSRPSVPSSSLSRSEPLPHSSGEGPG